MAAFRYDPYLWIHLAGVATVPLWLAIGGLGLAVGSPSSPALELSAVILLGIIPILVMQLWQPFYIFSLPLMVLKPSALTDDQRRLLTLFRQGWVRFVSLLLPLPLVAVVIQLYSVAVVASDITPFSPVGRLGGLAVAAASLLMAHLFLQVPVSVLLVMATPESRFSKIEPYAVTQVTQGFTVLGLHFQRLLPVVIPPEHVVKHSGQAPPPDEDLALFAYPGAATELYPHGPSHQREDVQPISTPLQRVVSSDGEEIEVSVVRSSDSSY
jgi:hypothetical protein